MFWTMLRGVVLVVLVGAVYGDPSIEASSGSVTVKPDQGGSLYVQPPGAPREAVAMVGDITALTAVISPTHHHCQHVAHPGALARAPTHSPSAAHTARCHPVPPPMCPIGRLSRPCPPYLSHCIFYFPFFFMM